MIKVRGNNGTRIVFSCTWNEKRKNEIEDVSMEMSKREKRGPGSVADASFPRPLPPSTLVDGAVSATFETPGVAEGT